METRHQTRTSDGLGLSALLSSAMINNPPRTFLPHPCWLVERANEATSE